MGTEQPAPAEQDLIEQYLEDMALNFIGPSLAMNACVAPPAVIVEALKVAGIDIILRRALAPPASSEVENPEVPHESPARRYSVRANPSAAGNGALATVSFRIPRAVKTIFEERVAELAATPESGIENQTDAGQDAIVKWCLMEGK